MKPNNIDRLDLNLDDKMKLTLGSAVRDGEFLTTPRAWPRMSVEEGGKVTHQEFWEESSQGSVV